MGHDDGCTAVPIEGWLAVGRRSRLDGPGRTVLEGIEGLVSCDIPGWCWTCLWLLAKPDAVPWFSLRYT